MKKAHELNTLCGVEIAAVIYSPYSNGPVVFPHYEDTLNTFRKFKSLPTLVQSKSVVTREEFTKVKEITNTNTKNEVLKEKVLPIDREGSTSNASQAVVGPVVPAAPPQMVPTVDPSRVPHRRAPIVAPPLPSTTMAYEVSASVFPVMIPQMDSSMYIPSVDLSLLMNDYQKYSVDGFPQSPALTE
ncbi:hypothetical protein T459_03133 [Capsicum annuum]|uniref:MADS-box domain-containing protein n=1 Tax=Capsicum annuum TaxID=4072 RepID=A0A2G3ALZ0_CAPAN|nr:hypothetical protein T459_03133 [Capsicum annuum]